MRQIENRRKRSSSKRRKLSALSPARRASQRRNVSLQKATSYLLSAKKALAGNHIEESLKFYKEALPIISKGAFSPNVRSKLVGLKVKVASLEGIFDQDQQLLNSDKENCMTEDHLRPNVSFISPPPERKKDFDHGHCEPHCEPVDDCAPAPGLPRTHYADGALRDISHIETHQEPQEQGGHMGTYQIQTVKSLLRFAVDMLQSPQMIKDCIIKLFEPLISIQQYFLENANLSGFSG